MKTRLKYISLFATIVLLSGCARGWTWVDGSSVDSASLEDAKAYCEIEQKQAQLEQAEDQFDYQMSQAENEEAKLDIKANYARTERRLNTEIRTCMRKLGLKPKQ